MVDQCYEITITGMVQGVGFRPFIWRLAVELGLHGDVSNRGAHVCIRISASPQKLENFLERVKHHGLRLAEINNFSVTPLAPVIWDAFNIVDSRDADGNMACPSDTAICDACLSEMLDENNRRYLYPFISCMHCGPRYSILYKLPYDRNNTSMAQFQLCAQCESEYLAPSDRRFHAQPIACSECGPQYQLVDKQGRGVGRETRSIENCADLINQGAIVAISGVGGFHLVCDAESEEAVNLLRIRKQRPDKPLAVMFPSVAVMKQYLDVNDQAIHELTSCTSPIVLLPKGEQSVRLAINIAPDNSHLGCLLPHTPVDHILMRFVKRPIVMTSGNLSGEPLISDNNQAFDCLGEVADYFLIHNRPIVNRLDDSVVKLADLSRIVIRSALGLAPKRISLPRGFEIAPSVLALGADLKATLCLTKRGEAVLSQHLGDLEGLGAWENYKLTLNSQVMLFQSKPELLAVDQHPEYRSRKSAVGNELPREYVQHHHAHIAACMGENLWPLSGGPILGVALDGAGWGEDQTLWGGELLAANYQTFERLGSIESFLLVGGEKAIRQPWRSLYSQLKRYDLLSSNTALDIFKDKPLDILDSMVAQGVNVLQTSSAGRLFDAVAALLTCCPDELSYEGQAAMMLESLAFMVNQDSALDAYPFEIKHEGSIKTIGWGACWVALLKDFTGAVPNTEIAYKFHQTFINAWVALVMMVGQERGIQTVALSGGVMQNNLIRQGLAKQLAAQGFSVLLPNAIPCNDGGISFGQALIASARRLDATQVIDN